MKLNASPLAILTMSMLRSLTSWTPSSLRLAFAPQLSWLHTGAPALGLPGMKKRTTVDPLIARAREERRVRRISKALRKMKDRNRILKPLVEVEVDPRVAREREERTRQVEVTEETEDERALLLKEWARHMGRRHKKEIRCIDRSVYNTLID